MTVLGVSVSGAAVRGVMLGRDGVAWAGEAEYTGLDDLAEVIARLAAELTPPARAVRIVLERDVVQLRTLVPAPRLDREALRRSVALEAPRLFRRTGQALVTDAGRIATAAGTSAVWAVAAAEPLVRAVLSGCSEAGLAVEAIGPAAEVLPHAARPDPGGELVLPNGGTAEMIAVGLRGAWRSRLVRANSDAEPLINATLVPALARLGDGARRYAAAFGVARARPRLALWPADIRAARAHTRLRRSAQLAALGLALWLAAAVVYVARLSFALRSSASSLAAVASAVDSALVVRREVGLARAALATMTAAERDRSQHLRLLAELTGALDDATYLVLLEVDDTGAMRMTGYSQSAARALTALEHVRWLGDVRFEGGVTREDSPGVGERERFTIVGRADRP